MRIYHKAMAIIALLLSAIFIPSTFADCTINGAAGIYGTAGNDTIVCNDPAPVPNTEEYIAGGDGGDDLIIIESSHHSDILGDGNSDSFGYSAVGNTGNDTIIVNGNSNASVYGDFTHGAIGGNNSITINGSVADIEGNYFTSTIPSTGGNNTITINGTVNNHVLGAFYPITSSAYAYTAGDNTFFINGTVGGNVIGSYHSGIGTHHGGDDTFTISSTANIGWDVMGDRGVTTGGNDSFTVALGAVIGGMIDGGNVNDDFDTLTFTGDTSDEAGYNQLQALVGCAAPCNGSFVIDGLIYTFTNIESLINLINLILPTLPSGKPIIINFDSGSAPTSSAPTTPQTLCEDGWIKVFRTATGEIEYYSGFQALPPNGFLVGKITPAELSAGLRTFADPNAHGWSVRLTQQGNGFSGQVFNQNGEPIGNPCLF